MWFFRRKRGDAANADAGMHVPYEQAYAHNPPEVHYPEHADHPWARPSADDAGQNQRGAAPSRTLLRPLIRFTLAFTTFLIIITALWLAAMMFYYTLKFPDPFAVQRNGKAPVIRILANDGSLLAERGAAHPYMPIDMLPSHVIDAVVATEDRRFFHHIGIDPLGMVRAMFANMRAGRFRQGGSTLTQQLAKNLFLSHDRTLNRKLNELSLAFWLEYRLDKREILELYLNRVYFGGGAYGIEAASQRFYGKSARAMNVAEAALVAGLLKAPSRYAPTANPGAGRARGRSVLCKMYAAGFLTRAQLQNAMKQPVRFANNKEKKSMRGNGYAVDYILDRLPRLLDTGKSDIVVETTIDATLQRTANKVITRQFKKSGKKLKASQTALVIMDRDGGIRTLIGGVDYALSQYNRATNAHRQPGSTFKPFVYLAALEAGYKPETITYDLPLSIKGWTPRNSNGRYRGTITVREALARSINTVAVRLALDVGPKKVASVSRRLGISAKLRADPSLALGTSEVPLLELVGAYNVFANGGRVTQTHIIHRIRTSGGRVLYARPAASDKQIVTPKNVGAMNDMLNAALLAGTGRRAALAEHPAAGKTGTSQQYRDAWFIGYTAHMTAGIWVGNDNAKPMHKVSGGSLPAQIWRTVMTSAHQDKTALPLPYTARVGTRISARGPSIRKVRALNVKRNSKANTRRAGRVNSPPARSAPARTTKARTGVKIVNAKVRLPPLPSRRPRYSKARSNAAVAAGAPRKRPTKVSARKRKTSPRRKPARALARSKQPASTSPVGFDVGDIRKRLNQPQRKSAPAASTARTRPTKPARGKMALGAQKPR